MNAVTETTIAATADDCYHCGLPLPPGGASEVVIDGAARPMCCPGCHAVAEAIVAAGLEDFYRHRSATANRPETLIPPELVLYDRPEVQRQFVATRGEGREATLLLEGLNCAACGWLIERRVTQLPGVESLVVNYATHRAQLRWDGQTPLSELLSAITRLGYGVHPFDPQRQHALQQRERGAALRRLAVAGLGMMQVMMLSVPLYGADNGLDPAMATFLRWVCLLITTPVVLYAAKPFFAAAWQSLRRRQVGMDVPVSLAIGGAFAASAWHTYVGAGEIYFDSVVMFTFFLLAGRFWEMETRHGAARRQEQLIRLLPTAARRLDPHGEPEWVATTELGPGDRVWVAPGDTLPADGVVVAGRSSVDEALLSGESLPVVKGVGDEVIGGAVNVESPLTVEVTRVGEEATLSALMRLLTRAQGEKPPVTLLADAVARYFILGLLVVATATGLFWWWWAPAYAFAIVLALLVVTCPCALSLATPAAVTAATGALIRKGVLLTRGASLEAIPKVTHVVFDKTGTLTEGRLTVTAVEVLGDTAKERCLALVAALERGSEHPVGRALAAACSDIPDLPPAVVELVNHPGCGVEGWIDGRRYRLGSAAFVAELSGVEAVGEGVVLGDARGPLARFILADTPRHDAAQAVATLKARGLTVILLSGDRPGTAQALAAALAIDHVVGGLKPADKLARVRALQGAGAVVAMVGDGVNDAPVLAAADLSLAMGSGTPLAQASADGILLTERLLPSPEALAVGGRTRAILRQNFAWALGYNFLALPATVVGLVAPWMAAVGMSLSSLLVVINAARLQKGD
ncbi:MAG: heavy metal translocating P-type ATPase [Candidatus Competibacterales bacterium]